MFASTDLGPSAISVAKRGLMDTLTARDSFSEISAGPCSVLSNREDVMMGTFGMVAVGHVRLLSTRTVASATEQLDVLIKFHWKVLDPWVHLLIGLVSSSVNITGLRPHIFKTSLFTSLPSWMILHSPKA